MIRSFVRNVLVEGIVDDLIKKYPQQASSIRFFSEHDPSPTNKYVRWMLKQRLLDKWNDSTIVNIVHAFNKHPEQFTSKDINFYKTVDDLRKEVLSIKPSKRSQKRADKGGAIKIGQVGQFLVCRMDTREAMVTYGYGTKWCVSMSTKADYWYDYAHQGIVFYVVFDTKSNRKACCYVEPGSRFSDEKLKTYDEHDNQHVGLRNVFGFFEYSYYAEKWNSKIVKMSFDEQNTINDMIMNDFKNSPWFRFFNNKMNDEERQEFAERNGLEP